MVNRDRIRSTLLKTHNKANSALEGKTMKLLMIKNEHYGKRYEIKSELKRRGLFGRTYPKTLEQVPEDMHSLFEMISPDFIL